MHTHTQEVRCSVTLARPAGSLAAFPQACLLSPGIKTYIHLQEPNSNPNPNPDMSSPPPLKHLGHCTSRKHPFHKGDEARSAGREPAFQGEQKPKKESHLGKPLYCRWVAQLCLDPLWPLDCSTPGFPVLYSLPEFAQILLRSHHPRMSNFLLERNDPELVTMTKTGRSARKRNADSPENSHLILISSCQRTFSISTPKNTRLSNQLSELIAPFRHSCFMNNGTVS